MEQDGTSATRNRVSVIIPAFNAEAYLAEAVASILRQTAPATEILVIDDGSTDGTGDIARSFADVTCVRQANAGVAAALNHGARIASGDCIAFLSADDIWSPDKLALQHQALQDTPNRVVFGHMQHFVSPELTPAQAAGLACPPEPMPAFSAGTLLTRLDTFRAIGPLNESFAVGEFLDWYGRARDRGTEVIMLEAVVSRRRVHLGNQSTKALREKSYTPVLKALLDRRRSAKVN